MGKVFEQLGTPWVFKVSPIDHHTKLWNNYIMHLRIQQSFDALSSLATGSRTRLVLFIMGFERAASIAPWIINTQHLGTIYQRPRYHTLKAAATQKPTFTLGTKNKANPNLRSPNPLVTPRPSRTQYNTTKKHV